MKLKSFSKLTKDRLDNYVYALVGPDNNEVFYVGRGKDNRGFQHLKNKAKSESEKTKIIAGIRARGKEPRLDIIRYGLNEKTAIEVESAIIDTIGLDKLSNSIRGKDTSKGRTKAEDLNIQLGGKHLNIEDINDNVILFFCHNSLAKNNDIYDSTRQFWPLSQTRITKRNVNGELYYKYALTMKGCTVIEVFEILQWYPAGSTVSSRKFIDDKKKRWEFIGSYPEKKIQKYYKNKLLYEGQSQLRPQQQGFRYIN